MQMQRITVPENWAKTKLTYTVVVSLSISPLAIVAKPRQ
jgi:hypothetical protein